MTYGGFPEADAELRQSAGALSTCEGLGEGERTGTRETKQGAELERGNPGELGEVWYVPIRRISASMTTTSCFTF